MTDEMTKREPMHLFLDEWIKHKPLEVGEKAWLDRGYIDWCLYHDPNRPKPEFSIRNPVTYKDMTNQPFHCEIENKPSSDTNDLLTPVELPDNVTK